MSDKTVEKNKVTVKIHGYDYKLISEDPKNYMQSVANYVDERMNGIAAANQKLSTSMIAVLTALNIADDHFRLKEEHQAVKELLSDGTARDTEGQTSAAAGDYAAMAKAFEQVLQQATQYQRELESLKDKLRLLSFELENREEALNESQNAIADLKMKLADLGA